MNKKNNKFINFYKNHLKDESKNYEVKPLSNTINDENLLKFNNFGLINKSDVNNNLNTNYNIRNSNNLTGSKYNPNTGIGTVNYKKFKSESSRSSNEEFRKIREGFSFGRLQYLNINPQRDGIINNKVKIGGINTRTKKSVTDEFVYENKYDFRDKFNYNNKKKIDIPPRPEKSFKFEYDKKLEKNNKYGFKY